MNLMLHPLQRRGVYAGVVKESHLDRDLEPRRQHEEIKFLDKNTRFFFSWINLINTLTNFVILRQQSRFSCAGLLAIVPLSPDYKVHSVVTTHFTDLVI